MPNSHFHDLLSSQECRLPTHQTIGSYKTCIVQSIRTHMLGHNPPATLTYIVSSQLYSAQLSQQYVALQDRFVPGRFNMRILEMPLSGLLRLLTYVSLISNILRRSYEKKTLLSLHGGISILLQTLILLLLSQSQTDWLPRF